MYFPLRMRIECQQHSKHRTNMGMAMLSVLIICWHTCDSLFMNSTSICLSLWGAMKYTHTSTRGSCKYEPLHQTRSTSCRPPKTTVVAEGRSHWGKATLCMVILTMSGVPQQYHRGLPTDQTRLPTEQGRTACDAGTLQTCGILGYG